MWSTCTCYGAGGSALVVKNLPSQRDFVLTNREELALIDQLALLAKVSCAAPRRALTEISTVFVIILAVLYVTTQSQWVPCHHVLKSTLHILLRSTVQSVSELTV